MDRRNLRLEGFRVPEPVRPSLHRLERIVRPLHWTARDHRRATAARAEAGRLESARGRRVRIGPAGPRKDAGFGRASRSEWPTEDLPELPHADPTRSTQRPSTPRDAQGDNPPPGQECVDSTPSGVSMHMFCNHNALPPDESFFHHLASGSRNLSRKRNFCCGWRREPVVYVSDASSGPRPGMVPRADSLVIRCRMKGARVKWLPVAGCLSGDIVSVR